MVRSDVQHAAPHKNRLSLAVNPVPPSAEPHAVIDFDQIAAAAGWARVVCCRGLSESAPMLAPLFGYFFSMIAMLTAVVVVLTGFSNTQR